MNQYQPSTNLTLYNLLSSLFHRKSDDVTYNQYQQLIPLKNIEQYLRFHLQNSTNNKFLVLGNTPSWNESVNTGIPLTSGEMIQKNPSFHSLRQQLSYTLTEKNLQSTLFYSLMNSKIFNECLFWNVFPFYPHSIDNIYKKRTLHNNESIEGMSYVNCLNILFRFNKVIVIGNHFLDFVLESFFADEGTTIGVLPTLTNKNKTIFLQEFKRIFYPNSQQTEYSQQLMLNTNKPTVPQEPPKRRKIYRHHIKNEFGFVDDDNGSDETTEQW